MQPGWDGFSNMSWWTRSGKHSLAELRSYQDWYLRYHLKRCRAWPRSPRSADFGRQYQVNVDPDRLQAYNIPDQPVAEAVRGEQQGRRAGG